MSLSDAMSLHDVYRGRGLDVLRHVEVPTRVVGITSDRLYPLYLQQQIADEIGVPLDIVESPFGHDGFLLEDDRIGAVVTELLAPQAVG